MSIQVKECNMVFPARQTPRKSLKLSRLDTRRRPYSHVSYIYIYHPEDTQNNNNNASQFFNTVVLKDSLSQALIPFYPLAGRLRQIKENGEIEIECNAHGVLFVEAETPRALDDFGDFKLNDEFRKMVIPTWDYSKGLSSIPLFMVQFTRFGCGCVCMSVATHHHIADGVGFQYFINSWARLARGLDLLILPVHERSCIPLLAPRNPPQVKFHHLEYEPRLPPLPPNDLPGDSATTMEGFFNISKSHINILKLEATSQKANHQGCVLSTYEVVAGHIWRCTCKVRGLENDQLVKLYIPIDARSRLKDSTLSKRFFGNLVCFTACIAKAEDIIFKPLWYAASKIHEALEKMEDVEYLKSSIDFLELQPDPMALHHGTDTVTCPNLLINSWGRIPFYEADFGWGTPKFLGNSGIKNEGLAFLIPTPIGDGSFSLSINLFKVHMHLFEKCLYNFKFISR